MNRNRYLKMSVDQLFESILESNDGTFQVEFEKLVEHGSNERVKSTVTTVLSDVPISNVIDIDGMTLLHLAAKYGNVELIKFLIDLGCDVNTKSASEETPLLTAYNYNHFEAMKVLLDANIDLNTFSIDKIEHILRDLITQKNDSLEALIIVFIQKLIKSSENIDTLALLLAKLDCPLKFVVNVGDPLFTQTIVRKRQYEVIYEYDETEAVFRHVMTIGDIDTLRVLWQTRRISDFIRRFLDKLNHDITRSSDDMKFIIPSFKQLDKWIVFDKYFKEFLWMVFLSADEAALEILLHECNVDVQMKEKYQFDVLPLLFGNMKNRTKNIGDLAFKRDFDINAKSFEGRTALHCAIFYNHSRDNVRLLLDLAADCSIKDDNGCSSLSMTYDSEYCQLMLQSGNHLPIGQNHEFEVLRLIQISGFYEVWKIFVAQLAFESYQGLEIKQLLVTEIERRSKIKMYYEECLRQMKKLMGQEIVPSLTMFDIMTGKAEKLAMHIQSEETISTIMEWSSQQNLDPLYKFSLKANSEKALNMFRSKRQVTSIIYKNTSVLINDDDLVIDKICSYLFYRDILKLASA